MGVMFMAMYPFDSLPQRVLVISAMPSPEALFSKTCETDTFETLYYRSEKQALATLKKAEISLVILRTEKIGKNTLSLANEIHKAPDTKYTPIVIISDQAPSDEVHGQCCQSGALDVLCSTVNRDVINAKVKLLLELDHHRRLIKQQSIELHETLHRLQHYSQHDQLTQLFNREQITKVLIQLMANARRTGHRIGLLFLDLDHFKNVNDALGHDIGDLLLKSVADRIKQTIRESDFVARLGGDEFAIVLNEVPHPQSAGEVAQKLLDKVVLPHYIEDHEVLVSCSVGIALYESGNQAVSDLLKAADSAMYQAKRKGRNQFAFFSETLESIARERTAIARNLNSAIDRDELSVFYQPQVSANGKNLIGFEALLRWYRDEQWIDPSLFVSVAEESGLIPKLGEWVLEKSCEDLKQWQDTGLFSKDIKIAINVSNRQLHASNFLSVLHRVIEKTQVDPHCLELELTESSVMDDPQESISTFKEIHKLGIELAVDDFGTGYSSLNYLKKLPLDVIKIDRSFVHDICLDQNDEAIVKAIINLSHSLGLKVVAEGVETEAQSRFLQSHECNYLQGFLYSRPLPKKHVENFVRNFRA